MVLLRLAPVASEPLAVLCKDVMDRGYRWLRAGPHRDISFARALKPASRASTRAWARCCSYAAHPLCRDASWRTALWSMTDRPYFRISNRDTACAFCRGALAESFLWPAALLAGGLGSRSVQAHVLRGNDAELMLRGDLRSKKSRAVAVSQVSSTSMSNTLRTLMA